MPFYIWRLNQMFWSPTEVYCVLAVCSLLQLHVSIIYWIYNLCNIHVRLELATFWLLQSLALTLEVFWLIITENKFSLLLLEWEGCQYGTLSSKISDLLIILSLIINIL